MEEQKFIYLIFSSTPYKMGAIIRKFTGEKYNHVAISLDPKLNILYSFARKYINTPFYGGFVKETVVRYQNSGRIADIKVFAIPVNQEQYKAVARCLYQMNINSCNYLYNMLSALFTPLHRKIIIDNAYTCIEFIVEVLSNCNICNNIDKARFYSLSDLQNLFENYIIYEGVFSNTDCKSINSKDAYIIKKNIAIRTYLTLSANASLIYLLLKSKVSSK